MKKQPKLQTINEPTTTELDQGRSRVAIENVKPEIDCGRFPAKRTVGEPMSVEADIFADGHDALSALLLYRKEGVSRWTEIPMQPLVNDRWRGAFDIQEIGDHYYTVQAWVDRFKTWRQGLAKKVEAGQDVALELLAGAELIELAAKRAAGEDRKSLNHFSAILRGDPSAAIQSGLDEALAILMEKYPDRRWAVTYDKELRVNVERGKARFSTWYELFPRSCAGTPGAHGTLRDCAERLPYVAGMGFDVLYLPPIHPIGYSFRKGKNNVLEAQPGDVGSPWAIGAKEGGHKAIHPQLGSLADFKRLVAEAKKFDIEIALDIAFQCTPDHPYVTEHPEWFRKRPDGSIQYAENPPKKYQDIYPLDFESEGWEELWNELKSVILFWCEQGVRIFRADNPHTKAFAFWEWVIGEVKKDYPDALFLAEAFTRPKVMYRLAKLGFSQSYTYFTWRNTKSELTQYFTDLTQTEVSDFFRPNLWPFELCENVPREPGSEEYLNSEKYEIKHWDLEKEGSLREFIARVNRIRRENRALQSDRSLRFHPVDNPEIIAFSKRTEDPSNVIVAVVNLDPHHTQSGWLDLPAEGLGLDPDQPFQMHDLLTDARYLWQGRRNFVQLDPQSVPAQIFRMRHRIHREQDFDYFM